MFYHNICYRLHTFHEVIKSRKSLLIFYFFFGGTGSYPLVPQGLHLAILFMASHSPLKGPCIFMASTAYCEHVGT